MCDVLEVEAKATAGAPEHEIEVTPEMIKAGAEILQDYFLDFGTVMASVLSADVLQAGVKARTPQNY